MLSGLAGCQFMNRTVTGNGVIVTENRSVAGFTRIASGGPMDVEIRPAPDFSVSIEGDENLLRYINFDKDGRKLKIKVRDDLNLRTSHGIKIRIGMPDIESLSCAGSGSIKAEGAFRSDRKLELNVSGSGRLEGNFDAPEVEANIAGSGNIYLSGRTRETDIDIAGSGDYRASDLMSENVKVSIAGSGSAHVYASMNLKISIAGSGDVFYRGNPVISQKVAGSGSIRKMEE
jgi:hypothetical protein